MSKIPPGSAEPAPSPPGKRKKKRKHHRVKISPKGLRSAQKRAIKGIVGEIHDRECKGLTLRLGGRGVAWTIRWRLSGTYHRWTLGDHQTHPDSARDRAFQAKRLCKNGVDPTAQIRAWVTGVAPQAAPAAPSLLWGDGKTLFLDWARQKRRSATYDDYRKMLNTPELTRFEGRAVATIRDSEIETMLGDVARRGLKRHPQHLQQVLSSMWTHLAKPANREITGVAPNAIRHVRAPDRDAKKISDIFSNVLHSDIADILHGGVPPPSELGRFVAIARLGVYGEPRSSGLLLLIGSAQRRTTVAEANAYWFRSDGEDELWYIAPCFLKSRESRVDRPRSTLPHLVPCVGFVATAVCTLKRLARQRQDEHKKLAEPDEQKWSWMLPVARPRKAGTVPKNPFIDPSAFNHMIAAMPGVRFSPHAIRAAFSTYGTRYLGWSLADTKKILDHLEGHNPNDVTAQHYNFDSEIDKKRAMMAAWVDWLEQQEKAATGADPMLLDREAMGELIYRQRYGDAAWKAALGRVPLPWQIGRI